MHQCLPSAEAETSSPLDVRQVPARLSTRESTTDTLTAVRSQASGADVDQAAPVAGNGNGCMVDGFAGLIPSGLHEAVCGILQYTRVFGLLPLLVRWINHLWQERRLSLCVEGGCFGRSGISVVV